jgi:predicted dehydrogenase
MVINYTMNAGYLPTEHWVHGAEGGGRNRGEACHVYDLFTFLTQSRVLRTQAEALNPRRNFYSGRDNFIAIFSFDDGSIASLTYTSAGSNAYAKETMQIFVDGKVIVMDDYRRLSGYGVRIEERPMRASDKGHVEELEAFAAAVRGVSGWPIALWEQVQATAMALQVEEQLRGDISSGIHEEENNPVGLPLEGD